MQRFSRSWALAKESYSVLKQYPQLAVFPVISAIMTTVVAASFLVPIWLTSDHSARGVQTPLHYVLLYASYFFSYFVVIFFNSALVSCVNDCFNGRPVSVTKGFENALRHLPQIFVWSAISASVGTILRAISERTGVIGQIVVGLFGAAWSLVTYFVIPVMIIENEPAVASIKTSGNLLRKAWGERVICGISLALAFGILILIGFIPIFGCAIFFIKGMIVLGITALAASVFYWIIVSIVFSTLAAIFNTALYLYASKGITASGFSQSSFQMAFKDKPASKIFGRTLGQ